MNGLQFDNSFGNLSKPSPWKIIKLPLTNIQNFKLWFSLQMTKTLIPYFLLYLPDKTISSFINLFKLFSQIKLGNVIYVLYRSISHQK
jgi:hypothetical protein